MQKENRLNYITALILALLVCFTVIALSGISGKAYAASSEYTDVLDDLNKDTSFNASAFSVKTTDYSLQVIQIAESKNGELFIYVYQPSGQAKNLTATTVRLSTAINDNAKWSDYKLTQINSNGVFYKYKVDDLKLKSDPLRYYNIVSIYRKWDSSIDKGTGNDNTINEMVYKVGQLWTAVTLNGEVSYNMTTTETIDITDKYVGRVRYNNVVFPLSGDYCDSWFVAFSTDKNIETLYEADVEYMSQYFYYELADIPFVGHVVTKNNSEKEPHKEAVTVTYKDKASNNGNGIFGNRYTWDRIETAEEFRKKEDLTEEAKSKLKNKQWVLNFKETDFKFSLNLDKRTEISEVTILRLKFETAGKVYNLGVVDNKQTGTSIVNGSEVVGFFKYLLNCLIKLFTGKASSWETFVAIATIVVILAVSGIAVAFLRWLKRCYFGKGKDKKK